MREFDIRTVGRRWTTEEVALLHDGLPGRLEMVGGKLCLDEDQRLLLLGALLEQVGTERAVRLGSLKAWQAAVAQREEDQRWDSMPAVGVEQFWLPKYQHLPFKKRLELKSLLKRRCRPRPGESLNGKRGQSSTAAYGLSIDPAREDIP